MSQLERIEKLLLLGALLVLLAIAASKIHSFDVFWQLQSGKHIVQTKDFIYRDTFSLAADVYRNEHCWLHDVFLYLIYLSSGYGGISLLKGVLVAGTALALFAAARVRQASLLSILALLPPAMLVTRGGWLERPQLWTFLIFALFVLLLERYMEKPSRAIWWLVPLVLLWANLHGGVVLAFPVMAAYLVGGGLDRLWVRPKGPRGACLRLWLVTAVLAAATCVTPYGRATLKVLFSAASLGGAKVESAAGKAAEASGQAVSGGIQGAMSQLYNMDWKHTSFYSDPYFYYAMGLAACLLLLGWRRLRLTDLLLLGGLAVMGLKLSRHTAFFLFACGAILPAYADAAAQTCLGRLAARWRLVLRCAVLAVAVAGIAYMTVPVYKEHGAFKLGLRAWHYPVEAAEFVKEHRLPKNLYNTYDWGGYLMWTLYPDYQVFWDGRSTSEKMFKLGWEVMAGRPNWQQILDDFDVKTVVTKACTVDTGQHYPVIDLLRKSPRWALVFADESSMIFVRNDAVEEIWLEEHRLPDSRIDATILSEARLLVEVDPFRYMAWWEIARHHMERREFAEAFAALENHLTHSPPGKHLPIADQYYRMLYPRIKGGQQQ